tara:strand:- start:1320 stop:2012 length:693 start_codon:yes stop_codon:yes gene_type:complete
MTQENYLYPILCGGAENTRLARLRHENVFYFYIRFPPQPIPRSQADAYDLPPPPSHPPELRRHPGHSSYHFSTPNYVMEQSMDKKVLCKAEPCVSHYTIYYQSTAAPPEVLLFENPGKWVACTWTLYPNGDIHYFVKKSLANTLHREQGNDSNYHYINKIQQHHSIIRTALPQLIFAIIKLKILLYRVRTRIKIRLFILNTHYTSSSPLRMLYGSHWGQVKKNIYDFIKY